MIRAASTSAAARSRQACATDHPVDLGQPYVDRLGFAREGDVLPDREGDVADRDFALVATVLGRDGR